MKSLLFPVVFTALLLIFCFPIAADINDDGIWEQTRTKKCKIEVEAGQTIDLFSSLILPWGEGHVHPEGKWKSSNKKIASVNKYGVVKVRKTGTAKITVKAGKTTYACTLKVKKKGTILKGNFKKLYNQYKVLKKESKKKISASNFSAILADLNKYNKMVEKYKARSLYSGVYDKKKKKFLYDESSIGELYRKLSEFASSKSSGLFTVTKVTRNSSKSLTFTLSKPVSTFQLDIMHYLYDPKSNTFDPPGIDFFGSNTEESLDISISCTFKKGSKEVKVSLASYNEGGDFSKVERIVFEKDSSEYMCSAGGKAFTF